MWVQPGCQGCCICGMVLIMELGLMAASLDLTAEVSSLFSQCERTTCRPQPDPALETLPPFTPERAGVIGRWRLGWAERAGTWPSFQLRPPTWSRRALLWACSRGNRPLPPVYRLNGHARLQSHQFSWPRHLCLHHSCLSQLDETADPTLVIAHLHGPTFFIYFFGNGPSVAELPSTHDVTG
jgi:hypothetical protein